jgi:hypothetical protein
VASVKMVLLETAEILIPNFKSIRGLILSRSGHIKDFRFWSLEFGLIGNFNRKLKI